MVFDGVAFAAASFLGRPRGRGEVPAGTVFDDVEDLAADGDLVLRFRAGVAFETFDVAALVGEDCRSGELLSVAFVGETFFTGVAFFGDAFFTIFVALVVLAEF